MLTTHGALGGIGFYANRPQIAGELRAPMAQRGLLDAQAHNIYGISLDHRRRYRKKYRCFVETR